MEHFLFGAVINLRPDPSVRPLIYYCAIKLIRFEFIEPHRICMYHPQAIQYDPLVCVRDRKVIKEGHKRPTLIFIQFIILCTFREEIWPPREGTSCARFLVIRFIAGYCLVMRGCEL